MKKIGITGGIGSGKSVISRLLRIMGYPVYDSDSWAKFLMNNNIDIRKALTTQFGNNVYNSEGLNRVFLAQQIFNNKEALFFVNTIVHPIVAQHFLHWTKEQKSDLVFIESAILFSSGLDKIIDNVIFVDAPQNIRLQRAILRDKTTKETILARINNQKTEEETARSKSKFHIINDNNQLLTPQILNLINTIKG